MIQSAITRYAELALGKKLYDQPVAQRYGYGRNGTQTLFKYDEK